jgi:hypothetical protein
MLAGWWKETQEMKFFLLIIFLIPSSAFSQEMYFAIDKFCMATGKGIDFKCEAKTGEFKLVKSGSKYYASPPLGGPKQSLKKIKVTPEIVILEYRVYFDGLTTVYFTEDLTKFYWVSVAYSTILNEREVSVVSGYRIK